MYAWKLFGLLHLKSIYSNLCSPILIRHTNAHSNICCRGICLEDDSSAVCLRLQFSNSKVLASTKESACHGLDICSCTGDACSVELVIHAQVGLGLGWSSSHAQYFMVAHCHFAVYLHSNHKIRWCLEWILLVGILRFVGFC